MSFLKDHLDLQWATMKKLSADLKRAMELHCAMDARRSSRLVKDAFDDQDCFNFRRMPMRALILLICNLNQDVPEETLKIIVSIGDTLAVYRVFEEKELRIIRQFEGKHSKTATRLLERTLRTNERERKKAIEESKTAEFMLDM